jgi:uncharacterized protein (DUF1697 family)
VDIEKLYVTFLAKAPTNFSLGIIRIPAGNEDDFQLKNREVYLFCRNGYGTTKLSNNFFEKKLNITATTRNWKTILVVCQT